MIWISLRTSSSVLHIVQCGMTLLCLTQWNCKWQSNVSLNLFLIGFLNIVKRYQHIKSLYMLGFERFGRCSDGVWKFEVKVGWVMSFFEKKLYFLPPRYRVLIMTSPLGGMISAFFKYCYFWIDILGFLTQTFEPAPPPSMFSYGVTLWANFS